MKLAIQYVNDMNGNTQAVQLPLSEWKRLVAKLKKYEQAFQLKSDLTEAFEQVAAIRAKTKTKQTLDSFLNEL